MAHAAELLDLAKLLVGLDPPHATQASLRRAVSTAYYALFHLLISEATANWEEAEFRHELGRVFEHGKMKAASSDLRNRLARELANSAPTASDYDSKAKLLCVTNAFVELQQQRNQADYNTAYQWSHADVVSHVKDAALAFEAWQQIRREKIAQGYLVSMLGKRP
jgi:uncharacterized protein (UPF0332 family)